MRLLLLFFGVFLLAACAKDNGPQRLDFVGTARYTSSNRAVRVPGDTLASRIYAEGPDNTLGRLLVTVKYSPRRNPLIYPTPPVRDSIDNNPDPDFIYLDTVLINNDQDKLNLSSFVYTNVFGVRTTSGTERWQYDLYDKAGALVASRAVRLSMHRADSTSIYQDYVLKLPVPATGSSARRFLHLRAGLALPAYTVLGLTRPETAAPRAAAQQLTDLIVLPDGLTLAAPDAATTNPALLKLDNQRWPPANRRATRLYLTTLAATDFAGVATNVNAAITGYYNAAVATGRGGAVVGPVSAGQVYAFQTGERVPRYGLLLVLSIPGNTGTTVTAGLQLEVRMAK